MVQRVENNKKPHRKQKTTKETYKHKRRPAVASSCMSRIYISVYWVTRSLLLQLFIHQEYFLYIILCSVTFCDQENVLPLFCKRVIEFARFSGFCSNLE